MTFTIRGRDAVCDGCRAELSNTWPAKTQHRCTDHTAPWLKAARERARKATQ